MEIKAEVLKKKKQVLSGLEEERRPWWSHWRELADLYLPRRYVWLLSDKERRRNVSRNTHILDATGTQAARVLASGMMNGITSPSRPWFKLRLAGGGELPDQATRAWLEEVERRMMLVMAESNFYNSLAIMYLDLVIFGTATMLIYEDFEKVVHCFNPALGEYYIAQDAQHRVNTFAREFTYKVHQLVGKFGFENCSLSVQEAYKAGGARLQEDITLIHLIEPNDERDGQLPKGFKFREYYWEKGSNEPNKILLVKGYREFPVVAPRWDLSGNDSYGGCPGMDALGDVIQLQHETKRKGQSLDLMNRPPMVADVQLEHRPSAVLPGGMTFVSGQNNVGMKPAYQVVPPIQELMQDIQMVQGRIREFFHNDLFRMISQLDTVRSATEIDARREEKLVLLGPVLERFENEALDPAINRFYAIMTRKGLIPEAPESIKDAELEIQYVSILSSAQSAVGVAPIERVLELVGQIAGAKPDIMDNIDWDALITEYGRDVGAKAKIFTSPEALAQIRGQRQEQAATEAAGATGMNLVQGAKTLSETDVGGGANALQQLLAQ